MQPTVAFGGGRLHAAPARVCTGLKQRQGVVQDLHSAIVGDVHARQACASNRQECSCVNRKQQLLQRELEKTSHSPSPESLQEGSKAIRERDLEQEAAWEGIRLQVLGHAAISLLHEALAVMMWSRMSHKTAGYHVHRARKSCASDAGDGARLPGNPGRSPAAPPELLAVTTARHRKDTKAEGSTFGLCSVAPRKAECSMSTSSGLFFSARSMFLA